MRDGEEKGKGKELEKEKEPEAMASWIGRITGSREAQFAATAVVSGAVVAGAILGYQNVRRRERVGELKADIPDLDDRKGGHSVGQVCLKMGVEIVNRWEVLTK